MSARDSDTTATMESYSKMVHGCLLLREIFGHLRLRDQLVARRVNKDWEDEACHTMWQNKNCRISFNSNGRLSDFILTFPSSSAAITVLSAVTVYVEVTSVRLERLEMFGRGYGHLVRSLHLYILGPYSNGRNHIRGQRSTNNDNNANQNQLESKVKAFLTHFTNLTHLCIEVDDRRICCCCTRVVGVSEPNGVPNVELPELDRLLRLDVMTSTTKVRLMHNILLKARNLRKVNLELKEDGEMPLDIDFLGALQRVNVEKFEILLNSHGAQSDNIFLRQLVRAPIKPRELLLFWSQMENTNVGALEERENLTFDLLTQVTRTEGLVKLELQNRAAYRIRLPTQMRHLTQLDFGESGYGNFQISQNQIPFLQKLIIGRDGKLLNPTEIFTSVEELVVLDVFNKDILKPPSYDWTTQFPNLTKLEMDVGKDGSFSLVLTHMMTLTHLKLWFTRKLFQYLQPNPISEEVLTGWWDEITGGIRPILNEKSSFDLVVPENRNRTMLTENPSTDVAKLGNLRNLTTLHVLKAPPTVISSIIHLTAIQQIPCLNKLVISCNDDGVYKPEPRYIDILKNYHDFCHFGDDDDDREDE